MAEEMLAGMRTSVFVVAWLLVLGALASCNTERGYRGVRDDGAVRVGFDVFTRGMLWNKKPSNDYYSVRRGAYVRLWLQRVLVNEAGHNVWVERCWGTAFDAEGRQLFMVRPFAPALALEPGDADVGGAMQPRIQPPVQEDVVRGVARYVADCETYRWEGPLPPPEFS
jgi:hypothetical protein